MLCPHYFRCGAGETMDRRSTTHNHRFSVGLYQTKPAVLVWFSIIGRVNCIRLVQALLMGYFTRLHEGLAHRAAHFWPTGN